MGILKHNIKKLANTHSHGDGVLCLLKKKKKPWIVNICKKETTIEFQFVALLIAIHNSFLLQLLQKPFTKHREAIN